MARPTSLLLRDLDVRYSNFDHNLFLWAFQMQCEIHELVLATRETIAVSRAMIADTDRILASKL
jgi:hypothetical protein